MAQYGVSLMVAILLRETGPRSAHGNFYWGLYSSGFFLMAFVWALLATNYNEAREKKVSLIGTDKAYFILCGILSVWHIISGVIYFSMLSFGGNGFSF